eukprot:CAMPEP_0196575284 /NCGR_PEP_ID=MMETSP1081-20130531/4795_1 /TAXON_ID=36882 /ORGANISM="Pyramimonas amylifera, Strain CCMP720" /LENGTH=261 /DNA_ID=CAMNT_0041893539 /DNA_START=63 /DNA_END=848 /DNA_ORIENTATION=+
MSKKDAKKDRKASLEPTPIPEPVVVENVAPPEKLFPDSPKEPQKKPVFSFPPQQLLHNNSYWKEMVNYKNPPGYSHAIRHKLTTSLTRPLPEELCEAMRQSLGEVNYKLLEESINIQSIPTNFRKPRASALSLPPEDNSKYGQREAQGIYSQVWSGNLADAEREAASNKLKELNKISMNPVKFGKKINGTEGVKRVKEKDLTQPQVSSFDEWFKTYGEVKAKKIPTAQLLKHGTNWNARTHTKILPKPIKMHYGASYSPPQ